MELNQLQIKQLKLRLRDAEREITGIVKAMVKTEKELEQFEEKLEDLENQKILLEKQLEGSR